MRLLGHASRVPRAPRRARILAYALALSCASSTTAWATDETEMSFGCPRCSGNVIDCRDGTCNFYPCHLSLWERLKTWLTC